MAALSRCCSIRSPTVPKAARAVASSVRVRVGQLARPPGSAPKFFAAIEIDRLTRLPQPATSSSLLRRRNSAQVKSVSVVSGPATATK